MTITPKTQEAWALVEHGQPLQKIKLPIPEPKGTEVLIRVTHCGVCHTDLHFIDGTTDLGGGRRSHVKDRGFTLPRAMGHEIVGTVAKLGPEADVSTAPVGSSRVVYPWVGCQKCHRCADEDDHLCMAPANRGVAVDGGWAQYITVPHPRYLVDYGEVDPSVACTFGCSGLTVLSSIQKLEPLRQTEHVLLIGAGGLGLACISMLRALGHDNIITADISTEKLDAARAAGSSEVINSKDEDAAQQVLKTAGRPLLSAIDFVGSRETTTFAMNCLGKGGTVVAVGLGGGSADVPMVPFILMSKQLVGNMVGTPKHLREVVSLAREGRLKPIPVTNVPWDETNEALRRLHDGDVTGRLVLVHDQAVPQRPE